MRIKTFVSLLLILFVGLSANTVHAQAYQPYSIKTLAGLPPGSVDGIGSAARFRIPNRVAVDTAGNVYVADTFNHTIRKITPAREVTTFGGSAGVPGYTDGPQAEALFTYPEGVAVASNGNVYVSEYDTIRKISPAGTVSTIAGGPTGKGSAQGFFAAFHGVCVDKDGNVYWASSDNVIYKVTANGNITTFAGSGQPGLQDGQGNTAQFNNPQGVAADGNGNVYVADTGNNLIRIITPEGVTGTIAGQPSGGSADGPAFEARFSQPMDVTVSGAGDIFVADTGNNTIRKISPAPGRIVSTIAGSASESGSQDGTGIAARFLSPQGVAVGGSGTLYVADRLNDTIRQITSDGEVTTFAGMASSGTANGAAGAARFTSPYGVAVDKAGTVFVADTNNHTIRKISPNGVVSIFAGGARVAGNVDGPGNIARFAFPKGVAVDNAGNVYVADTYNSTIRKITPAGQVSTLAYLGTYDGLNPDPINANPQGVAVAKSGVVYATDTTGSSIRKITPTGAVTVLAGRPGQDGEDDGAGAEATFYHPKAIAIDDDGLLYVADGSNIVRKVTPAGVVTTLVAEGMIFSARAEGIGVDGMKNIYVSDLLKGTIIKITSQGAAVITVAGRPNEYANELGSDDGIGSAATFARPRGLAVDKTGRVYVADTSNNTIRVGAAATTAVNISTRMQVGTDPDELIAGFIVTGDTATVKEFIVRALGPSIKVNGQAVPGTLQNPVLELRDGDGQLIRSNDDWKVEQQQAIEATGIPPSDERESAIVETLAPGSYTAIVRGKDSAKGIGVVEVYDLVTPSNMQLAQISTRGKVLTDDNVMIGGFILSGAATVDVLVRAIGPELNGKVADPLQDPTLKLYNSNGTVIGANDDWRSNQGEAIADTGVPPTDDRESAILKGLPPGSYTAIVSGKDNSTGVGLVEVYLLR